MSYIKKFFAFLTITAVIFGFAGITGLGTYALDANSAVICIEAFTVDGGFILQPEQVSVNGTSTVSDLINNAIGRSKVNQGTGAGSSINGIAVDDSSVLDVNSDVASALSTKNVTAGNSTAAAGWLSANDFTNQSRWIIIVNNKASSLTPDNYKPVAGDVVRIAFSVFGNGADLALDKSNMPAASTEQPIFEAANRDELYKAIATYNLNSDFELDSYISAETENPASSQDDIDDALDHLNNEYDEVEPSDFDDDTEDDVEPGEEDDTGTDTDNTDDSDNSEVTAPAQTTPQTTPPTAPATAPQTTNPVDTIPKAPSSPTNANIVYAIPLAGIAGVLIYLFRRKR